MSKPRQSPESDARAARGARLTAAGVIAAYIHEISGRHRDELAGAEAPLNSEPAD